MKMAKRIFAAACALSLACSMAACGSSSSDSSSSKKEAKAMTDDQKEQVNALQDKLPDIELSNKTIKWMAHYDINPSDGKSESPAISLGTIDILTLLRQLWLMTHLTSSLLTTWTHSLRVLSRPCSSLSTM